MSSSNFTFTLQAASSSVILLSEHQTRDSLANATNVSMESDEDGPLVVAIVNDHVPNYRGFVWPEPTGPLPDGDDFADEDDSVPGKLPWSIASLDTSSPPSVTVLSLLKLS